MRTNDIEKTLREAEEKLLKGDYLGAMARLESAWHLHPNDPAIIQMQERIQRAQKAESNERYENKLKEARAMLLEGQDELAFSMTQQVLEEDPSHRSAKTLQDQILDSRWAKVQEPILQGLELAFQPLTFCDFEVAESLLTKLQNEIEMDSCRKEIERIRKTVATLDSAFQSQQYYDVPPVVKKLLSKDPFRWLAPHRAVFAGIQSVAAERSSIQERSVHEALSESRNFLNSGHYIQALGKVDQLLSDRSVPEAEDLRFEILQAYRESKLQEAREFTIQLEWEKAIACWKEILHFFPESTEIQRLVLQAESQVRTEIEIQQELFRQLKHCYFLILKDHWAEAQDLVESMLKSIQPGFRLIEMERQIEALQAKVLLHNRRQQKQLESVNEELSEIRKLYKRGSYGEALEKISLLLEMDSVQEEALEMKVSIEKAIRVQSVSLRFQAAVQKGKEYFERRNWLKAIEFWKKASLLSEETYVKEWIDQAEQRLKKERQTRLSIIAMLAEADELIFYNKFAEAGRKIDRCRKALSAEFSLDDLSEQIRKLTGKLESEIQKEETLRSILQAELEEAEHLYRQKFYPQALQKLYAVLQQQPEMEAAMQLKSLIEAAENEEHNVLEIIRAVVKLVVKRDFKQLPGMLLKLKETSTRTPYAEDCISIVDEIPLLVLEIESGDRMPVQERLDRLFSRSLLLLEYEQTLRNFVESLETKNQKERQLENVLQQGLELLESGKREKALQCLDKFHQILDGKGESRIARPPDYLDKTATFTDDDLKLTEFELQTLQHTLLHHEVESILAAAQDTLIAGDKMLAEELFLKALEIEPENGAALEGLRLLKE